MKAMQTLRDLGLPELESKIAELKKEQFALRAKKSTGSLEKPAALGAMRKQIARVHTLISQKSGAGKSQKTQSTQNTKHKRVGGEQ